MFTPVPEYTLEDLKELKEQGNLKPLFEFKRDDLKYVIEKDLATVEELSQLFNVSKAKVQDFKRIKRLRDADLEYEKSLDEKVNLVNYFYATVKTKINDEIDSTIKKNKEMYTKEDIENLGESIKKNIVDFIEDFESLADIAKQKTLYENEK